MKIQATDHAGKPVRARVSLSVVDKALVDLYDEIKKPIPYFFNRIGSAVVNYSNWKNLRKKFYDRAFRNAAVVTE